MTTASIVFAVLLYCLIGVLFLVAYILAMKPQEKTTLLGLIMLFWPLVILIEAVLALAHEFGKVGMVISNRIKKAT